MTALTWVLLAFAVIGLLFGLWQWTARRRTVQRLDNMLEQSISSGFTEEHFDETELSALETKFARFLRGSAHTQKTMKIVRPINITLYVNERLSYKEHRVDA